MTGILPIKKYSESSILNNFTEYTLATDDKFGEYFSFTDDEVDELYQRYLQNTARPTIERDDLRYWYDGYHTPLGIQIYNPNSVVQALDRNRIRNY